jgi:hypothetical protein
MMELAWDRQLPEIVGCRTFLGRHPSRPHGASADRKLVSLTVAPRWPRRRPRPAGRWRRVPSRRPSGGDRDGRVAPGMALLATRVDSLLAQFREDLGLSLDLRTSQWPIQPGRASGAERSHLNRTTCPDRRTSCHRVVGPGARAYGGAARRAYPSGALVRLLGGQIGAVCQATAPAGSAGHETGAPGLPVVGHVTCSGRPHSPL